MNVIGGNLNFESEMGETNFFYLPKLHYYSFRIIFYSIIIKAEINPQSVL